ncbi:expressed unknown protein [Seminavis robusta]|uniref:Uncharacterized protein n=1 Tax=Seminavis robusta TaxID=568900 RepID=A0A9N8HK83_9STRA|nr:expressed unknown protein [Seminavis robusta]|eukprot:Sro921_g220420.1 n/a (102) ;mRNA; r:32687-32992
MDSRGQSTTWMPMGNNQAVPLLSLLRGAPPRQGRVPPSMQQAALQDLIAEALNIVEELVLDEGDQREVGAENETKVSLAVASSNGDDDVEAHSNTFSSGRL